MDDATIFVYDPTIEQDSILLLESQVDNLNCSPTSIERNKYESKRNEGDIMSSIQDAKHSLNFLEVQVMQKVNKESALRNLFTREMNLIHTKIRSILNMIQSLPTQLSNSRPISNQNQSETTVHLFVDPSVPDLSLSQEMDLVSTNILSIEEHVKTLVHGFGTLSIPLSERIHSLQYSLSQLLLRSQSLSKSFEKITLAYNAILKNSSFSLTRNEKMVNVSQVYEKVMEVEPLLMMASTLQKKMEELMELTSAVQTIDGRIKKLEERQDELEKLVQDSLNMVSTIKNQMNKEIPELIKLADSLVQ